MTCRTMTDWAVKDAGLRGPPKRARITAVVEKPSSALIAAWFGISAFSGWMFSVPSVDPAKYRSVGYGRMPANGWNSAAVGAWGVIGVTPAGLPLPLAVSVGPTVPCPPEHAPRKSAAARHAAITNLSILSLVLLAESPPVANPSAPCLLLS